MAAAVFAPSASLVSAPKAVVTRKSIAGAAGECLTAGTGMYTRLIDLRILSFFYERI